MDYAFQTVCALGITDGPVHGEYMVDGEGPVLIEANCRVMGGSAPAGFLDRVLGHHETDIILRCMLDRDFHEAFRRRLYRPLRKGYVKDFASGMAQTISASGIIPILLNMKSFHSGRVVNAGRTDFIPEAVDLATVTGCVYLVHEDDGVTRREFEFLMKLEEQYPELLYSNGPLFRAPEDTSMLTPDMNRILRSDTETLLADMSQACRAGKEPAIPEGLLDACPYNREIMDLIREFCSL